MAFRIDPLTSRVGRRIARVVLIAAMVPLTVFGSVVFSRGRIQVETQERERLHEDVKSAALVGLERLLMLEAGLRTLVLPGVGDISQRLASLPMLDGVDTVVLQTGPDVAPRHLRGTRTPASLTEEHRRRLRLGRGRLIRGADRTAWIAVGDDVGGVAMARVPYKETFGYGRRPLLRPTNILCILDDTHVVLSCSGDDARVPALVEAADVPRHGDYELAIDGQPHLVRTWSLPLQTDYGAGTWVVAMMVPRAEAAAPLRALRREVILLAVASVLVVLLAVLGTVRKQLGPLAVLEDASARVRAKQYDVVPDVRSNDEFETLAHAFGSMVGAIREHVSELEAFSVGAATALARTIDAKSPWTAGHSERVTEMALDLGRALQLSADDMAVLQRGGLLHDIGKLAISSAILDKPGKPTDEERAEIEKHPATGVRILEPIAAFAAILPIVGQHHERFDGAGYPARLAGTQIDRLARVLAIADVYDALRSDRPYRQGLPLAVVVDYISKGAGTQFDPDMVAVFVQLMRPRLATEQAAMGIDVPAA